MARRWYRSETDRFVSGVSGGMAAHFDWDPSLVRLGWLLTAIFTGGLALLVYLVLWVVTPSASRLAGVTEEGVAVAPADERRTAGGAAIVVGGVLIGAGVLALLSTFGGLGIWQIWHVWQFWPLILIGIGGLLLLRRGAA